MDSKEIAHLASVLRENGDEVLNSTRKLCLSADLLNQLNSAFALIAEQRDSLNTTFQVINCSNIKVELYRDLQFLHDFVQRTVSLKLIPCFVGSSYCDLLNVSKFRNLKLLEVHKLNVTLLAGLQVLRTQLQFLVCVRSLNSLREILEKCGADDSEGFIWCELKEAVFSHNELKELDGSLEFVPWLHTLDLSHNKIKNAAQLNCLPNLKNLNLGYNQLDSIKPLSGQLCNRLQVLILRNNFIEDIRELTALVNLCELDLSHNCLLHHDALAPLAYLAALQWLCVEGNPLSFHPLHRSRTARYLHMNTATVRFMLDRSLLNKSEQRFIGSLQLLHSSIQRNNLSSHFNESTSAQSDRTRRIRNATISDHDVDEASEMDQSTASLASLLVTSGEHLETKRQIEQLREQYGETWLQSHGGSLVQDALGLERTPLPVSSSPYEREFLIHADIDINKPFNDVSSELSTNNTAYITATDESVASETSLYANEETIVGTEPPQSDCDDIDEDLGEGEENLYIATIKDTGEQVFIVLTETHIRERECESGNEKVRWLLESLLSCEVLGEERTEIRLEFDTVRRDKRERLYALEADEVARLATFLGNILASRPLQHGKLTVYKCMKCSTQFTREKSVRGRETPAQECPTCESTLVIEDD